MPDCVWVVRLFGCGLGGSPDCVWVVRLPDCVWVVLLPGCVWMTRLPGCGLGGSHDCVCLAAIRRSQVGTMGPSGRLHVTVGRPRDCTMPKHTSKLNMKHIFRQISTGHIMVGALRWLCHRRVQVQELRSYILHKSGEVGRVIVSNMDRPNSSIAPPWRRLGASAKSMPRKR